MQDDIKVMEKKFSSMIKLSTMLREHKEKVNCYSPWNPLRIDTSGLMCFMKDSPSTWSLCMNECVLNGGTVMWFFNENEQKYFNNFIKRALNYPDGVPYHLSLRRYSKQHTASYKGSPLIFHRYRSANITGAGAHATYFTGTTGELYFKSLNADKKFECFCRKFWYASLNNMGSISNLFQSIYFILISIELIGYIVLYCKHFCVIDTTAQVKYKSTVRLVPFLTVRKIC